MLRELIERLERGESGRELDRDIAISLGSYEGWHDLGCFADPATACCDGEIFTAPHYTTSLDAALPGENIVAMGREHKGHWWAEHQEQDGAIYIGTGPTEVAARRNAALKAREPAPAAGEET